MNRSEEREVLTVRVIAASRERLFAAWTDAAQLARWWGPKDFTNTIHRLELKPEGIWEFTMHGPDGMNFRNACVFKRIDAPSYLEFDHLQEMHFYKAMVTFSEVPEGSRVQWVMRFNTAAGLAPIRSFIEQANQENMDRLEALLLASC